MSYGVCSHFHSICPLGLLFYMKYHDAHDIFSYFIDQLLKMLRQNGFLLRARSRQRTAIADNYNEYICERQELSMKI